ncbi:MAG: DUF2231 domain-containing protein [Marmoricola sp.]
MTADPFVPVMTSLEGATALDPAVRLLDPVADALVADPERRDVLQGRWLGHALHPLLTDLPIGFWTSASVLDLLGGKGARPAATLLTALGVAAAVPTAATGLAEYAPIEQRDKRVAVVHASANSAALLCYTASLAARLRGRHGRGVVLALAGSGVAAVGGYLGGHLTEARKVGSHDPAFDEAPPVPTAVP